MKIIRREHGWIVNIYDFTKKPGEQIIAQFLVIASDEATAAHKFLGHAAAGIIHRPGRSYTINRAKYII